MSGFTRYIFDLIRPTTPHELWRGLADGPRREYLKTHDARREVVTN